MLALPPEVFCLFLEAEKPEKHKQIIKVISGIRNWKRP